MRGFYLATVASVGSALLPALPARAQEAAEEAPAASSFEEVREQGILYFKKDRFPQSKSQLDRAYKMKGGDADFTTVYYRGRAAYKLLVLETAFAMAEKAKALAGEDARKQKMVEEWQQEMQGLYGGVTIKAAAGETNTEGRVFLEAKTGIINKEKKQTFLSIRERFRSTDVQVPTTIYLPYGDYTANNVPFALAQGEPQPTVELFLQVVKRESDGGSNVWLYAGIAGGVAIAAGVAAFFLLAEDDQTKVDQRASVVLQAARERP
jgi:hypothetical protein